MKYLYVRKNEDGDVFSDKIIVKVFRPRLFGGLMLSGEMRSIKQLFARLFFQTITVGKARVFYVSDGDSLMHTSYVIPNCIKFPFMKKDDLEIGPCYTYPEYRGRGLYPAVLRAICNYYKDGNVHYYMIVDSENTASIKGIEKAGFEKCGTVRVTKYTKRYKLERML